MRENILHPPSSPSSHRIVSMEHRRQRPHPTVSHHQCRRETFIERRRRRFTTKEGSHRSCIGVQQRCSYGATTIARPNAEKRNERTRQVHRDTKHIKCQPASATSLHADLTKHANVTLRALESVNGNSQAVPTTDGYHLSQNGYGGGGGGSDGEVNDMSLAICHHGCTELWGRVPVDTTRDPAPVCRALERHPISSSTR